MRWAWHLAGAVIRGWCAMGPRRALSLPDSCCPRPMRRCAFWKRFRITPRTPTGPSFTPRELPGGSVTAFVTSRFQGAGGAGVAGGAGGWPCRGEVILDLPAAAVLRYAREGIVEELGPDRCRLVLGSWSWPGLAAAFGRFDADIEVVGPAELRAAFARLARRYAVAADGSAAQPGRRAQA